MSRLVLKVICMKRITITLENEVWRSLLKYIAKYYEKGEYVSITKAINDLLKKELRV